MGTYANLVQASPSHAQKEEQKPSMAERTSAHSLEATNQASEQPANHDPMTPRDHDTMGSWIHDTSIEIIRKAVKQVGKEGATHRFTTEEKQAITDLLYVI